jgi:hypothetical protein
MTPWPNSQNFVLFVLSYPSFMGTRILAMGRRSSSGCHHYPESWDGGIVNELILEVILTDPCIILVEKNID